MKFGPFCFAALVVFYALSLTGYVFAQDKKSNRSVSFGQQKHSSIRDKIMGIEIINGKPAAANQVLVRFKKNLENNRIAGLLNNLNIIEDRLISDINVHLIKSERVSAFSLTSILSQLPEVERVEPDYIAKINAIPNDQNFNNQWSLRNTGQTIGGQEGFISSDIKAVPAWNISKGTRAIAVGVVDTGILYNHPDLIDNVWSAPTSYTVNIGGVPVTCNAGTHGIDTIDNTCVPFDDHGHGSHVSGIIGAKGNNDTGIAGINWTTSLIGLKAFDQNGEALNSDIIFAIDVAVQIKQIFGNQANIRILNNSYDTTPSQFLLDKINLTNSHNILFVASAGNGGEDEEGDNNDVTPTYPASYSVPNIISVAALDNRNQLADFSNYGAQTVHLGAPGVNIYSTLLGNGYGYDSGTSQAAPQVVGAAALILSRCSLNTAEVKNVILNNVDSWPSLTNRTITGGKLNIYRALNNCASEPFPNSYSTTIIEGAHDLFPNDINNNGQVLGGTLLPLGTGHKPYIYDVNSGMTILPTSANNPSSPFYGRGINSQGWATGAGQQEGFFYSYLSGVQNLGVSPGYSGTIGFAVNDSGVVVGEISGPNGRKAAFHITRPGSSNAGVSFLDPNFRPISGAVDVNNRGQVAAFSEDTSTGVHQFYIANIANSPPTYTFVNPPTGIRRLNPKAINENGVVVGEAVSQTTGAPLRGFIYDPATGVSIISHPNNKNFYFHDVNDAGQAVGYADDGGVIYDLTNGLRNLNTLISPGWSVVEARAINNKGQIVVWVFSLTGTPPNKIALLTPRHQTSAGTNAQVQTGSVAVVYSQVSSPGETFVGPLPLPPDSMLPNNYLLTGSSLVYDVRTTASFVGTNRVCFNLLSVTDQQTFNRMKLLHFENGRYVDRTVSRDFSTLEICANATSLSPFLAAELSASVPAGFEGDVASRPNGDGVIQSNDVVQVRRFLNTADTADTTTTEFQRADSAPFDIRGDGVIQSNDVVQARRFLNTADTVQTASGPSAPPSGGQSSFAGTGGDQLVSAPAAMTRTLRVENANTSANQQVTVNIRVDAVGDESEYGFAVNYNSMILSNPQVGAGNAGAAIRDCFVNPAGRLNCSVGAFPNNNPASSNPGIGEIGMGDNQILITVTFTVVSNAPEGETPLTFSNVNASNDAAQGLTIGSTNGAVTVAGSTAAGVSVSGRVSASNGRGLARARVSYTDMEGNVRSALTNSFGYYRLEALAAGQTYVFGVTAKGRQFAPRVMTVNEEVENLNFSAEP
jgi:hypothetical protein